MKIGIIGCGYVGQAVAQHWKQKGHHIAVTTRQPEKVNSLKRIADDVYLLGHDSLGSFVAQQEALLICVAPDSSSDYVSTYLNTARQVANHIASSASLKQIFYTSSTSVYGDHAGRWVNEATPLPLNQENGQILYETESTLLPCTSSHLKVCIFRLGEIYGPGREIEQRLRRMQHHSFAGTGDSYTNLIHLNDIVRALDFALEQELQGIYNLCNDFHVPRKEFYESICQKEKLSPVQWDPTRTSTHAGNRRVSNEKIKKAGFTFTHAHYFDEDGA